jgi:hypothetical protein
MKKLFGLIALVLLTSCTDEDSSRRTLKSAGYKDIQITGHAMFACGQDDTFSTGFTATNPTGQRVTGTVCCGFWSKGCTIRF